MISNEQETKVYTKYLSAYYEMSSFILYYIFKSMYKHIMFKYRHIMKKLVEYISEFNMHIYYLCSSVFNCRQRRM